MLPLLKFKLNVIDYLKKSCTVITKTAEDGRQIVTDTGELQTSYRKVTVEEQTFTHKSQGNTILSGASHDESTYFQEKSQLS